MVDIGVIRVNFENLTVDRLRLSRLPRLVQPNPRLKELRNSTRWNRARGDSNAVDRTVVPFSRGTSCQCLLVPFRYSIHRLTCGDNPSATIKNKQLAEC